MRKLLTLCILCFSLSQGGFAQKTGPGNDRPAGYEPNTYEKVSIQLTPNAGETEVGDAIRQRKPLLSETGTEIQLETYKQSPGGSHYTFAQTFRGIPVFDASIKANLTVSNRIMSLLDNLKNIVPTPQGDFIKSESDAKTRVQQGYENGQSRFSMTCRTAWWSTPTGLIPVYVIETDGNLNVWEVILNANDLSEIRVRDRAVYRNNPTGGGKTSLDSSGTGMVFNPDPLTTAGVSYGGNYVDNNDQNSSFLNNERQSVILEDILYNNGTFRLTGPYVLINDSLEAPNQAAPTSTNGTFDYLRADQGFEAVMCYYHIDHFQRYIQSLGFTNIFNAQIWVDPHGLNGQDNSHFVGGANPRVSFGEGGVDDAEDADVIIHEYGHALSSSASPNSNSGNERNGLDEGIGDYLGTSYSKSINTFHWDFMFTWDGHNTFWGGRDATNSMLYPPSGFNFYDYGEIWNTALMRAWDSLGQTISDRVFFQELFMNNSNMTLNDAAHLIIDADTMLYSGVHTNTYQSIFCNRNIFTGPECIVAIDGKITEDFRWNLYPNPANDRMILSVPAYHTMGKLTFALLDISGKLIKSGPITDYTTELSLSDLSEGLYLVKMIENGETASTRKLVIQH